MVFFDHTRPNGKNFRSVTYNGVGADLEILAGGVNTVKGAISSWYSEKKYWVNRDTSEATGHYTTMIRPIMLYMGLGCFTNNLGASRSWAGEFSGQTGLRSYRQNFHGDCIQKMEVDASKLGNPVVKADDSLTGIMIGSTTKLVAYDSVDYGNFLEEPIPVLAAQVPGWSSSKPGVAKVSADGVVKGLKAGTAVVSPLSGMAALGKSRSWSLLLKSGPS